jgi:hypothetical protein
LSAGLETVTVCGVDVVAADTLFCERGVVRMALVLNGLASNPGVDGTL